ncbi:AAA family ATPase [Helicobacter mehlei]|uniref:AAA family ATPase n=1 Tax=Helicobacter mehlei TaxID=2316080 RepID=A0A553UMT3_9HELI|nr:ATPase domain-containing protein [Helicobacter mehlei]TSA81485.1 AAA family ATPase [Helicobacter mehlei]
MSYDHNLLEKSIVRSCTAYPQWLEEFLEGLPLETFEPPHQQVLSALLELKNKNKPISLATLIQTLGQEFSTSTAFKELFEDPRIEAMPSYLHLKDDLRTALLLKTQRKLTEELAKANLSGVIFDMDFLGKFVRLESHRPARSFAEWAAEFAKSPPLKKFPTGINFLDRSLKGGITENSLVLISGDSEAGKTTLGVQILRHLSMEHRVLYYSLEFPLKNFVDTMNRVQEQIGSAIFDPVNFRMDDGGLSGLTIDELVAQIKQEAKEGTKVFLIDSQMMIRVSAGRRSEEEQTKKFFRLAEIINAQLGVVILFIVQTSKSDPTTPFDTKLGAHAATIHIGVSKYKQWDNPKQRPYMRRIEFYKNKQEGLLNQAIFRAHTPLFMLKEWIKIDPKDPQKGERALNFEINTEEHTQEEPE